jgi:hypothetical protein
VRYLAEEQDAETGFVHPSGWTALQARPLAPAPATPRNAAGRGPCKGIACGAIAVRARIAP